MTLKDNSNEDSNYPSISNYVDAIKNAEYNFATLTDIRPVFDDNNNPIFCEGDNSVVFKMKDIKTGKLYAVKCFTNHQEGRDVAYRKIADYLADVDAPYILPIKYLENELFVDADQTQETEFSILLMDWAEGTPLDVFIDNCRSSDNLQTLSYRFALMATWLLRQPFAHGDLKPDNILVNPSTFQPVLVDYDGMFVPAMNGQKARELGSPDYRHPRRTIDDFNEHIDDFALTVMQLLIDAGHAAGKKSIHYHVADLTLHNRDFADIANSGTMRTYFSYFDNAVLVKTYIHFLQTLQSESMTIPDSVISNWESIIPDNERLWFDHNVKYTENWVKLISAPETIEIYVIKDGCNEIGYQAFRGCSDLTSIVIPDSVTEIGSSAFSDCSGLTSVVIPDSVTEIGGGAFGGCSGLTSITIPDSVTEIGDCAFYGCGGLTSVTIGNSVTEIGTGAFYGCSGLTKVEISDLAAWCKIKFGGSDANPLCCARHLYLNGSEIKDLVIPDSVTEIGTGAFYGCSGLTSVTIGNSVTEIGYGAFDGCSGLTKVEISDLSAWCKIIFGGSDANPLCCARHLYLNGSEIKDLVIPNSVTSIGSYAFSYCSGLTSVIIPNSVTEIGDCAFYCCSGLTSLSIPDSVTSIGSSAFRGCSGLTSLSIPDSVTEIGDCAFDGCSGLRTITVAQGNTKYDSRNDCNTIIETASNTLIVGSKNTIIPDSVTSIGDCAFDGCSGLTSVTIPDSVTEIGDDAFRGCSGLTSVTIPDSVTKIGDYAFYGCGGLTSVTIGNSVAKIGDCAFYECSGLTSVTIGNSVTVIGWEAFKGCSGLTSVTIGNSVTEIGDDAFRGCSGLTYITIPDSVTEIGDYAFDGCSGLTSIFIPRGSLDRFIEMLPYELYSILIEQ